MSKQIELEYLSMIDQVIFACDDKLNVLYNNYHERFYDSIMRKVEDHVNMKQLRSKSVMKLDKFFVNSVKPIKSDPKTMRQLVKMFDTFDFDPTDEDKFSYYNKMQVFDMLEALDRYSQRIKRQLL